MSANSSRQRWISRLLWAVAIASMIYMTVLLSSRAPVAISAAFNPDENFGMPTEVVEPTMEVIEEEAPLSMPPLENQNTEVELSRTTSMDTTIPERSRDEPVVYRVQSGDAIFGIAGSFDLKPESVLWANYDTLNDDPHSISPGQALYIPPTDGILYKWEEGDTLEYIADKYDVEISDILGWPGNKLDLTNPVIEPGKYIMIPGGYRETQTWVVPTIWAANSGANESIPGACTVPAGGAVGTGGFMWPANNTYISGNDYWSGHLGIDIAAMTGDPIYAADSGVIVYSGGISGGYGNMVMIDHGNGYHTLYAHLNSVNVSCGQSVMQGQIIGYAGSTGNSTGPHLHFEVRLNGGFVNPHYVLGF